MLSPSRKRGTLSLRCNSLTTQVPFTEDVWTVRWRERSGLAGANLDKLNLDGGVYNRGLPSLTSRLFNVLFLVFYIISWNTGMAEQIPGHFGLRMMWHMMNGVVRESVVLP